ncbi:MAG: hypothetical protein AAF561_06315 [Planctomycetota bacterium]
MNPQTIDQPRPQRTPVVAPGHVQPHARDMSVEASADVTLGEINNQLAELSPVPQWLPLDGESDATLRELIDVDSTGVLRTNFGGWRDRLTGIQFTGGDGRLVSAGGLPVKNVAGYDLVKLMVGSRGAFGRLVTVTARTVRRPDVAFVQDIDTTTNAPAEIVGDLLTSDVPPQWLRLTSDGLRAGWLAIEDDANALAQALPNAERHSLEDDDDERRPRPSACRCVVPAATVATFVAELDADGHGGRWVADPVAGVVWCDHDVSADATRHGGHAIATDNNGSRIVGLSRGAASILRELKAQFDPDGTLPALPQLGEDRLEASPTHAIDSDDR